MGSKTSDEISSKLSSISPNALSALSYNLLSIKVDSVIDRMGFPKNWKDISNIERSVDRVEETE